MAPKIPVALQFTGGINRFNRPRDIRDDELISSKNLYPKNPGQLATRPSSELNLFLLVHRPIYFGITSFTSDLPIIIIDRDVENNQNTRILAGAPNSFGGYVIEDFGAVTQYVPGVLYYGNKVYAFGGEGSNSNGKVISKVGGVTTASDFVFNGTGNSGLRPQIAIEYLQRIVYGNLGAGYESALTFSDPRTPEEITPDALAVNGGYALIQPGDGDRIVAFAVLTETGGAPVRSTLLVLKEYSAHLLTGQPPLADGSLDPGDLQVLRMPINCGCSSPATVVNTGFGVIWASHDDVWFFPEGQLPYRIGTKLRPQLEATPKNVRYKWHAAYHAGFYRLALFAEGQGPGDDSLCEEQWWLDLRSGPPRNWQEAQWWGPHTYKAYGFNAGFHVGTSAMFEGAIPGQENDLYMIGPSDFGYVVGAYTLSGDSDHDTTATPSASVEGTEIEVEIVTKEYVRIISNDKLVVDDIQEKGLQGAEVDLFTSTNGRIYWYWILNDGEEVSARQETTMTPDGFLLDTDLLDTDRLSAQRINVGLDPAPERPVGKSIQLKIQNSVGYVTDATNDEIVVDIDGTEFIAGISHSIWTNALQLATQVADAIFAASGVEVVASLSTGLIRFVATNGETLTWSSAHGVSTDLQKSRVLANQLGFTAFDGAGYTGSTITATAEVYTKLSQRLQFEAITLWFYRVARRIL